jgi:hypothetical protein
LGATHARNAFAAFAIAAARVCECRLGAALADTGVSLESVQQALSKIPGSLEPAGR